jgi:hypothetical protein
MNKGRQPLGGRTFHKQIAPETSATPRAVKSLQVENSRVALEPNRYKQRTRSGKSTTPAKSRPLRAEPLLVAVLMSPNG